MVSALPLPTLLSHALVAYTIELDNEFERQMPHVTSASIKAGRPAYGPWLASFVMWSNCLQFVHGDGVPVRELPRLARVTKEAMHTMLAGMQRWGYLQVTPDPADPRPKSPRADWVVRPTAHGRKADAVWRALPGIVEERWDARFGNDDVDALRNALRVLLTKVDQDLPQFFPMVRHQTGLRVEVVRDAGEQPARPRSEEVRGFALHTLLSQVLLAFTFEFERESDVSLAINANVLRVLDDNGVAVRELPRLTGVSKEALSTSINFLEKHAYVDVEAGPVASRGKHARLSAKGRSAQEAYRQLLSAGQARWQTRYASNEVGHLRASLEALVGDGDLERSPLLPGVVPPPGGWRAGLKTPATLPHHPMVLHRGGYPDGG